MKRITTAAFLTALALLFSGCLPVAVKPAEPVAPVEPAEPVAPVKPVALPKPAEPAGSPYAEWGDEWRRPGEWISFPEPEAEPLPSASDEYFGAPTTYDRYFGVERMWPTVVKFTPDEWDWWPKKTVLPPETEGAKQLEGTWCGSRLETSESVYVLNGRELFMTSEGGTKATLIHTGEEISRLYCDGFALYFLEGNMLRRMFIPDRRVDDIHIIKSERNPTGEYRVYSNYCTYWPDGMTLADKKREAARQGRTLEDFIEDPRMTVGVFKNYNSMTGEFYYGDNHNCEMKGIDHYVE